MVSATSMFEELKTGNQGQTVVLFASCSILSVFYSPHWLTLLLHYFFLFLLSFVFQTLTLFADNAVIWCVTYFWQIDVCAHFSHPFTCLQLLDIRVFWSWDRGVFFKRSRCIFFWFERSRCIFFLRSYIIWSLKTKAFEQPLFSLFWVIHLQDR